MKWMLVLVIIAGLAWYYFFYSNGKLPALPWAPAAAQATPPERVKHLAPQGVYYLLQRVSITTDDGIVGVDAGTKVTLVKDTGASLQVTDGKTQFEVTPNQVTNDMDTAGALTKKTQASDAAIDASIQSHEAALHQQQLDQLASQAKAEKEQPTPTPAPPVQQATPGVLDRGAGPP
jgi:hypothetical protein